MLGSGAGRLISSSRASLCNRVERHETIFQYYSHKRHLNLYKTEPKDLHISNWFVGVSANTDNNLKCFYLLAVKDTSMIFFFRHAKAGTQWVKSIRQERQRARKFYALRNRDKFGGLPALGRVASQSHEKWCGSYVGERPQTMLPFHLVEFPNST